MEEKTVLKVDTRASDKVSGWRVLFTIFAWLFLIAGIITIIGGIYDDEPTEIIIGGSVIVLAFVFFFNSALLRGLKVLT